MPLITTITDRGRQILAARVPGDPPLASIKIAVGDGNGSMPTPSNAQVALVNERWRGTGAAGLNGSKIGFTVNIPANVGGWTIREIGVFVGPAGAEELLVVSQFGPQYKPAAGENGASSLTPVVGIDYTGSAVGAFSITLDANLNPVDPSVHRTVDGVAYGAPPSPAPDGMVVAIASTATGDFLGRGGQIAKRRGTQWTFENPLSGHIVRDTGSGAFFHKIGADYVGYAFPVATHNQPWGTITEKPTTFPPSAHNHEMGDVNGLIAALAGKVAKTGDNMSGSLTVSFGSGLASMQDGVIELARIGGAVIDMKDDGNDDFDVRLHQIGNILRIIGSLDLFGDATIRGNILGHEAAFARTISSDPLASLLLGAYIQMYGSAHASYPRVLALGNGGAHRLIIDALGRIGIGTTTPSDLLDVNGNIVLRGNLVGPTSGHALTLGADPGGSITAGGFAQVYGQSHPTNPGRVSLGSGGVDRLAFVAGGAAELSGQLAGGAGKIASSDASGRLVWQTLAQLGAGKKIIALGPATSGATVTIPEEPNTSYTAKVLYNAPYYRSESQLEGHTVGVADASSKTTTSFVIPTDASLASADASVFFYIAWRD